MKLGLKLGFQTNGLPLYHVTLFSVLHHSFRNEYSIRGDLFTYLFKDLFILERKRVESGGGGKGERESQVDSLLSSEPNMGLDLATPMS